MFKLNFRLERIKALHSKTIKIVELQTNYRQACFTNYKIWS